MTRTARWLKQALGPLALISLAALVGCAATPRELSFETIEQQASAGTGKAWESEKPGLIVVATPEELNQIDDLVSRDAQEELRQADYDAYFVVAVFIGRRPTSSRAQFQRVVRRGGQVTLDVLDQGPGYIPVVSSPYFLIKVRKDGKWGRRCTFRLRLTDGEQRTVSVSHYIP